MKPMFSFIRYTLVLVMASALSILLFGCVINVNGVGPNTMNGSGNVLTVSRPVGGTFSAVNISFAGNVDVVCKQTPGIEITADDNLIPYVRTEVSGGVLRIYTDNISFSSYRRLQVRVNADMIDRLDQSGSGNTTVSALNTSSFSTLLSGSGNITLQGSAQYLTMTISGSGAMDSRSLTAQQANVLISGSGNMFVYATQLLDAKISGSGSILYYGNPATVRQSVSGSGTITPGRS